MYLYLTFLNVHLKYSGWPLWVFQGDHYLELITLLFPWWRVIACHVTHRSHNSAEWLMFCFYLIFLFKIFTHLLAMAWNIWYSDCQIYASGSVMLFKHLYNDRVSWAICAVMLVCTTFRESDLLDLQHVNSSTSPEIHESKWPVNWEKNRVNFKVTYTMCYLHNLIWIKRVV